MARPLVPILATGALALAIGPAPASAAPTFEARLEPQRIAFGGEAPSARLTIRTGAEAAALNVSISPTADEYRGLTGRETGAVLGVGCPKPRLEGPGDAGPASCVMASPPVPCHETHLPIAHGTYGGAAQLKVEVPPESQTALVVPLLLAHTAPWRDSGYEVRFRVHGAGLPPEGHVVATPRSAPTGRTGVRLSIATDVPSGALCEPVPEVDGPVTITGRSDPPLAGQEVVLRYGTAAEPRPRELARVKAAGDGTFALSGWRPPGPGHYEIAAAYTAQRPELADDFSPLRAFRVRPAGPDGGGLGDRGGGNGGDGGAGGSGPPEASRPPGASAPAVAVVRSRRIRFGAGGLGAVRLACPTSAARPCAGRLRIRAHGRVLAACAVIVAPGARPVVRVRLRPAARRLLRRRGRLKATVRIDSGARVPVVLRRAR